MHFLGRGAEGRRPAGPYPASATGLVLPLSGLMLTDVSGGGGSSEASAGGWGWGRRQQRRLSPGRGARHPAITKPLPFHSMRAPLTAPCPPPAPPPACLLPTSASGGKSLQQKPSPKPFCHNKQSKNQQLPGEPAARDAERKQLPFCLRRGRLRERSSALSTRSNQRAGSDRRVRVF